MLFLFSIFLAPLVSVIPSEAAVPALVLVGFLMMQQVKGISWDDIEIAIPAFLTIILMPFTYSISVGIGAGFLAFVLIKAVKGKAAQVHPCSGSSPACSSSTSPSTPSPSSSPDADPAEVHVQGR